MAKTVDISNAGDALNEIIKNVGIDGKRVIAEELQRMGTFVFPQAVFRFYPTVLRVRSGRLRQSFEGFSERASDTEWSIGMRSRNVAYARIQHDGGKTPPHVILPRNKKALFWEGAAHPVRRVNHPGSTIPATKFFEKPMNEEVQPMIDRILKRIGFRP